MTKSEFTGFNHEVPQTPGDLLYPESLDTHSTSSVPHSNFVPSVNLDGLSAQARQDIEDAIFRRSLQRRSDLFLEEAKRMRLNNSGGLTPEFVVRYCQFVRSSGFHPLKAFGSSWTLDNLEAGYFTTRSQKSSASPRSDYRDFKDAPDFAFVHEDPASKAE